MEKNSPFIKNIVAMLSIFAMALGLIYGIILLYRNVFLKQEMENTEVNILAVLLAVGLLGTVLEYIFKKAVEDFLKKYLSDEKIKKLADNRLNEFETEVKENLQNVEIEASGKVEIDTVIVPVARSINLIRQNNFYECPDRYSFKTSLKYIAFYKDKKIVGYGKITSDYQVNQNGKRIFAIEKFIAKEISHKGKGAYLRNKKYCTFESLDSAKSTADIKP